MAWRIFEFRDQAGPAILIFDWKKEKQFKVADDGERAEKKRLKPFKFPEEAVTPC
jgi:hypothetical protein